MLKFKVALFDVDGVLLRPPQLFSDVYSRKYGVDLDTLVQFYSSKEFKHSSIGKLDLKQALRIHNDKWQWQGDFDSLLNEWFEAENYPNQPLIAKAQELRTQGVKVFIATQQEKYRAEFLQQKVFSGMFDGFFISCELGLHKSSGEFWEEVIKRLQAELKALEADEIIFFDDTKKIVDVAASKGIDAHLFTETSSALNALT